MRAGSMSLRSTRSFSTNAEQIGGMPLGQRTLALAERGTSTVDDHRFTSHNLNLMRIAVLVKQVPKFEEMELGPDGRLRARRHRARDEPVLPARGGQAVELAAEHDANYAQSRCSRSGRRPPTTRSAKRSRGDSNATSTIDGVLVSDPAFAGSDTLATAKAVAAALTHEGPFDLVLTGRNSVDADTGQVAPEVAELLALPFLTGVRHLTIEAIRVHARCEHDDGWVQADVALPADPVVRRAPHRSRARSIRPGAPRSTRR